jgi:hypothetical protein
MEEGDLRVNYEQELNNLRNAQKNAAVADLQATRDTSLSNLQAEEAKIKPTYAAQRSTANAQNRIAARNFQEYLANTGRANSGIGAQYEMSRQNSLQNGLNAINSAEAQSLADIARRRSDVQNAYNTGLASANANVEANYIKNLLDQRQQQWERDFQQKQFDESVRQYNQNRQDQLNRAFSSGGGSGSSSRSSSSRKSKTSKTKTGSNDDYETYSNDVKSAATNAVAKAFANLGGGASSALDNQNRAVQNAAKPGERYVRQVPTANGGTASQLWMKTANGQDYRIA